MPRNSFSLFKAYVKFNLLKQKNSVNLINYVGSELVVNGKLCVIRQF